MPRENPVGFTVLNAVEHFIEDWSARNLGRLLFDEDICNREIISSSHFSKFGDLIVDAADLTGKIVGGFAGVNEEGVVAHAFTLARNRASAKGMNSDN